MQKIATFDSRQNDQKLEAELEKYIQEKFKIIQVIPLIREYNSRSSMPFTDNNNLKYSNLVTAIIILEESVS